MPDYPHFRTCGTAMMRMLRFNSVSNRPIARLKSLREIHRKSCLKADPRARLVFAAKRGESQCHALMDQVLPADQYLELALAQISVLGVPAIDLGAKRQPGGEVVQEREASV